MKNTQILVGFVAVFALFLVACTQQPMLDKDESMMETSAPAQKDTMVASDDTSMKKDDAMVAQEDAAMKDSEVKKEDAMLKESDSMVQKEDTMMKDSDSMMKKEDAMMVDGDAMAGKTDSMMKESGASYQEYSEEQYASAVKDGKTIVLFFYANWCPTCKTEDAMFSSVAKDVDSSVAVFRVNYRDSETDPSEEALARKYGISSQHTKVIIQNNAVVKKDPSSWTAMQAKSQLAAVV